MKKKEKEKVFADSKLRPCGIVKMTYIDFVRYMRWYTIDSRSYLLRKLTNPPFSLHNHQID